MRRFPFPDTTVVYYTSNKENNDFEQKILKSLLYSIGNLPLITVSQKPMDVGMNICVGDVGRSNHNIFRQLQIGAIAAKSKYIATAESDCLYPPEYFTWEPPKDNKAYKCGSLYIMFYNNVGFFKKRHSLCGMITSREHLIDRVERVLFNKPKWVSYQSKNSHEYLFKKGRFNLFYIDYPIINIKTKENLHKKTWVDKPINPVYELPYWGKEETIREYFL